MSEYTGVLQATALIEIGFGSERVNVSPAVRASATCVDDLPLPDTNASQRSRPDWALLKASQSRYPVRGDFREARMARNTQAT